MRDCMNSVSFVDSIFPECGYYMNSVLIQPIEPLGDIENPDDIDSDSSCNDEYVEV